MRRRSSAGGRRIVATPARAREGDADAAVAWGTFTSPAALLNGVRRASLTPAARRAARRGDGDHAAHIVRATMARFGGEVPTHPQGAHP